MSSFDDIILYKMLLNNIIHSSRQNFSVEYMLKFVSVTISERFESSETGEEIIFFCSHSLCTVGVLPTVPSVHCLRSAKLGFCLLPFDKTYCDPSMIIA
jgi:hypothetical protein